MEKADDRIKIEGCPEQNLKGIVTIKMLHKTTGEEKIIQNNLVVDVTYSNLAHMLGGDFTNFEVNYVKAGTGTNPPAASDTGITALVPAMDPLYTTATYPSTDKVSFSAVWDWGELRNDDITELGMFFKNNTLCARTVFSAMKKSTDWKWIITWELFYPAEY